MTQGERPGPEAGALPLRVLRVLRCAGRAGVAGSAGHGAAVPIVIRSVGVGW